MLLRKVEYFISKNAFDINGLGPKILEKLLSKGLIKTPADLFTLTAEDLKSIERFAEKSSQNIINSINSRKIINLDRFINALGIPSVGIETSSSKKKEFELLMKGGTRLKVLKRYSPSDNRLVIECVEL